MSPNVALSAFIIAVIVYVARKSRPTKPPIHPLPVSNVLEKFWRQLSNVKRAEWAK